MTIIKPPTFEEAMQMGITDPDYGIGCRWLWQLPPDWPGTKTALIHDLRYDYLKPGESTLTIDDEALAGWRAEGCPEVSNLAFYKIMRLWGEIFEHGYIMCKILNSHEWSPCSYGQAGKAYDLRCSRCGLHAPLELGETEAMQIVSLDN